MMLDQNVSNLINAIIPISRFNKGEAGKIFDEVSISGVKVVVKNNKPTCVLITPEKYEELMETIENYQLLFEAANRMKAARDGDFVSHEDVLSEMGINKNEIDDFDDVELV